MKRDKNSLEIIVFCMFKAIVYGPLKHVQEGGQPSSKETIAEGDLRQANNSRDRDSP